MFDVNSNTIDVPIDTLEGLIGFEGQIAIADETVHYTLATDRIRGSRRRFGYEFELLRDLYLGPESETAQERDATILFEGSPMAYELGKGMLQQPNATSDSPNVPLARVTFKVTKHIRGEKRDNWITLMRGAGLPKSFKEFTSRFSSNLRVGLREVGQKIDTSKLPANFRNLPFVVDAACSINGEDWLLWPMTAR